MATAAITKFFVDAFASALELGIASPDDMIKHATPDVLSKHLPRPIWAKLIAACLAAPRTDAALVVSTIGVPDLCEHVPATILWACLAEIGTRALGKSLLAMAPPPPAVAPTGVSDSKLAVGTSPGTQPAPAAPIAASGSQPVMTHIPTRAQTEPPAPLGELPPVGSRTPTPVPARTQTGSFPRPGTGPVVSTTAPPASASGGNGLRASSAGASTRRPQAAATPTATVPAEPAPPASGGRERKGPRTAPPGPKRGATAPASAADFEIDTDVSEWKQTSKPEAVVVDDDLVDWAQAEETATGGVDLERKR